MRLERLFHVLVVMAPLTTGCDTEEDRDERREDPKADAGGDSGVASVDAPPVSTADGGAATPCFCDVQSCCDRSSSPPQVVAGFECCWSTTCP